MWTDIHVARRVRTASVPHAHTCYKSTGVCLQKTIIQYISSFAEMTEPFFVVIFRFRTSGGNKLFVGNDMKKRLIYNILYFDDIIISICVLFHFAAEHARTRPLSIIIIIMAS